MVSIFISHSSKDKFLARKLAEQLKLNGVDVWIDEAELQIGDSLIKKIAEAVNRTDYVAIILTHNSVQSGWVQKELQIAMNEEIEGKRVKVLPLLFEKCGMPDYLKDKLYADFTNPDDFNTPFLRLLRSVKISKPLIEVARAEEVAPSPPPTEVAIPISPIELEGFEDITIIGVDKEKLYRPNPDKSLYNVYLELSAVPPSEWVDIFDGERRFPRHTMWRKAWIDGQYAVVHCALDEIKAYHLHDLQQDVNNSNIKYREYLRRLAVEKGQEQRREEEERKSIDDALDGLDL